MIVRARHLGWLYSSDHDLCTHESTAAMAACEKIAPRASSQHSSTNSNRNPAPSGRAIGSWWLLGESQFSLGMSPWLMTLVDGLTPVNTNWTQGYLTSNKKKRTSSWMGYWEELEGEGRGIGLKYTVCMYEVLKDKIINKIKSRWYIFKNYTYETGHGIERP